jgi:sarcosine oxidase subunit gamma
MADYLWCALANAGAEWGVPEQVPVKGERLTIA